MSRTEAEKEGGGSVKGLVLHLAHKDLFGWCLSNTLCLHSTHTHRHTLAQIPAEPALHAQAEFTPPLLLLQCSGSTLFCNAVMQSHQLFIKDFCSWSVADRQTWNSTGTFETFFLQTSVYSNKIIQSLTFENIL